LSNLPHIRVDATVITNDILSGVGHYSLGIVRGFDELAGEGKLTYSLIAPWRRSRRLKQLGLKHCRSIQRIPIPEKYLNGLRYFHLPLPIDLLFGPGYYYFPHFRSWPLWFAKAAVVIHDMGYEAVPGTVLGKNREYLKRVVPASARSAKAVLVPSAFSRDEVAKYLKINPDKIHVAYPAVDRKHFYKRTTAEVKKIKAKYDIFTDSYLLAVGNIEPRKNYSNLVDAYTALPPEITKQHPLVIVGADSWNNSEILAKIQKAKEAGFWIIHPKQFVPDDDLPALYSGARLFLFTPIYEGFGMPPLEALACGTPAVVADAASVPEAAGSAAVYADPTSVKDIKAKIYDTLQALDKDPHKFDKAITEHIDGFNSWRHSAEITAAALTGLPVDQFKS
jgi:glycosyltransferase involved in cell wall biosynthesis